MPESKTIAEKNTIEVPLYTIADAVRYLRVPIWWVIRATPNARFLHPRYLFEELYFCTHLKNGSANESEFVNEKFERLTFRMFATIFILNGACRADFFDMYGKYWNSKKVIHLVGLMQSLYGKVGNDPRVLTDPEWLTEQIEECFIFDSDNARQNLLKCIALYQSRVETKEGVPVQLFPFSRDPNSDAPRTVVIDPEIRFGKPTVKGVPTDVIADRWRAGDRSQDLAEDYTLTFEEVDEALRYESMNNHPLFTAPFYY